MWANAQRDGRPAEYTLRPLFNAANFGWRPLIECRAVMLSRCESLWNLQGCPNLPNRSQPLGSQSSPYYENVWTVEEILLLNKILFPIVDTCLSCKDIAGQSFEMVPRWRLFGDFLRHVFSAIRAQHVSDLYSKFTLRPHHVWMVDIQSLTAEIRRGKKKKERKKEETTGWKYIYGLPYYIGRP